MVVKFMIPDQLELANSQMDFTSQEYSVRGVSPAALIVVSDKLIVVQLGAPGSLYRTL